MGSELNPVVPAKDMWLNSGLIGANSYCVLSDGEEYAASFLEEDVDAIFRSGSEKHFVRLIGKKDKNEVWFVPFGGSSRNVERFAEIVDKVQSELLGMKGFIFPFDLISTRDYSVYKFGDLISGYVVFPYDRSKYYPIRKALMVSDAPRWALSLSLFRRLRELHSLGLALNGFSREQVRVEKGTNEVVLCLNEYTTMLDQFNAKHRLNSFLAIPDATEAKVREAGKRLSGNTRDIFSAAVLSFYLLHYSHPFIGNAFGSVIRQQYLTFYQNKPTYLFDPEGNNTPNNLQYGVEIRRQWQRTVPELKKLYSELFLAVSHPERFSWDEGAAEWMSIDRWIACLEKDAAANDNELSLSHYPFESERLHQV